MTDAERFLERFTVGKPDDSQIALWKKQNKRSIYAGDVADAAGAVNGTTTDLYIGVALFPSDIAERVKARNGGRPKSAEASLLPGVWIDFDVDGTPDPTPSDPHRVKTGAAPDMGTAIECSRLFIEPTMLVQSGGGIHAWYLFEEAWTLVDDEDRQRAEAFVERFQKAHREKVGFKIDSTHDLARLLRLPGTFNGKGTPPAPVALILADGPSHDRSALEALFPAHVDEAPPKAPPAPKPVESKEVFPFDKFEALLENNDNFAQTWKRERRDKPNWSASEYDLSIGNFARAAGFTDAEIVALWRRWRTKHGEDPAKVDRADYVRDTLAKLDDGKVDVFGKGANGKPKFIPRKLAEHLRSEAPVAVGGERLYIFAGGAYRDDGEDRLRARMTQLLGDTWKKAMADEVLAYLRASSPRLWEKPPVDRVNCASGIIDLSTGQLLAHDPGFLSPVQIAAAFDPSATCPAIDAFLAEVLPEDTIPLVHEIAAYLVTPDNSLQRAFMLLGNGSNGKSTLLNVLTAFLGKEHVSAVELQKLDEDRFAPADLYGRLANICADLDARALRSSSSFKAITGGDTLRAERKNRDPFHFVPYARLLFSANEPPPTPDGSHAFFRRWIVVTFDRTFSDAEKKPKLIDALTTPTELSGLLNHALRARPALIERGNFRTTSSTDAAMERFKRDADSVAGFIADSCQLDAEQTIERPAMYGAYKAWCVDNARRPYRVAVFNERLRTHFPQLEEIAVHGVRYWRGIRLAIEDAA